MVNSPSRDSPSDFQKIAELQDQQDEMRDVLFFSSVHSVGQSAPFGQGRRSNDLGSELGAKAWKWIETAVTEINELGNATGVFDKISIQSIAATITGPVGTLIVKSIQHVSDGKIFTLSPGQGRTVELTPGGGGPDIGKGIDIPSKIILTDSDMVIMQYSADTDKVKVISSGSSSSTIPDGTVENEHLEWDNTAKVWNAVVAITLGATGPFADSGFIRYPNDQIMLSARNALDDGNLELKVDSGDFFDITESNNGPIGLKLRAQHAVNPDNTLTLIQFSGTSGVGELFAPNQMNFLGSGAVQVFNYDQNRIVTNVNILPGADGTLKVGNNTSPNRFLSMHAAEFGIDSNSRLNFTVGGNTELNQGTAITIKIGGVQKFQITSSITQIVGNTDITGTLDVGGLLDMQGNAIDNITILTSNAADPGDTGFIRMGNAETLVWESNPSGVDVTLQVNTSNNFVFSGSLTPSGTRTVGLSSDRWNTVFTEFLDVNSNAVFNADMIMGNTDADNIFINGQINTSLIPDLTTLDLGRTTDRWRHLYLQAGFNVSKVFFDGGGDTYITGSGTSGRINIFNDGTNRIAFTNNGLELLAADLILDSGQKVKAGTSTEIGIQVGNEALTIGTEGSLIGPYLQATVYPTNAATETDFGNVNGGIGVQHDTDLGGSQDARITFRAGGVWYQIVGTKI